MSAPRRRGPARAMRAPRCKGSARPVPPRREGPARRPVVQGRRGEKGQKTAQTAGRKANFVCDLPSGAAPAGGFILPLKSRLFCV